MSDITAKIISIDPDDAPASSESDLLSPSGDRLAKRDGPALPDEVPSSMSTMWVCAILAALLWIAAVGIITIFAFGLPWTPNTISPVQWAGLAALGLIPAMIILLLGYVAKQMTALTAQTRALTRAADAISRPDIEAESRAATLAGAVRSQIINVDTSLKQSMDRLAGMETVLKGHTDALSTSHIAATRQTGEITRRLAEERDGLKSISSSFDERMNALSRMLSEHSERLAQSTHMAEQKIQEARVSVEGAAAKINASSEVVRENALQATESLTTSHDSISSLADNIKSQASVLDEINARHAAEMTTLVEQLQTEQAEMNASIEARLEKMRDMSLSAQVSAESLHEASEAGRQTVEALAQSANLTDDAVKQRFAQMEDMVRYSNAKAESISERAAKRVRDSLSLTRMEIGRIEGDMQALEMRLSGKTMEFERRDAALDVTPVKNSWRKSLLRFRPAEDEHAEPTQQTPKAPLITSIEPEIETEVMAATEYTDTEIEPPVIRTASKPLDLDVVAPSSEILTPELAPVEVPQDLSLEIEDELEMAIPNPNAAILDAADSVIAPIQPSLRRPKKEKRGWSWKNMLGGLERDESASTDRVVTQTPLTDMSTLTQETLGSLTKIGLSPNAIVDDGCIIEAVNVRKAKGPSAMREIVTKRLSDPIRHLREHFASDPGLKQQADQFATRYYQSLSAYENDREGLRAQLETETGRAFMLCDAALG